LERNDLFLGLRQKKTKQDDQEDAVTPGNKKATNHN
jgi:hypothetical protein